MTHLDDGILLAHLDGEVREAESERLREHLDRCARCAARLRELEAEHDAAARAVALLDEPAPVAAARRELRRRLDGRGAAIPSGRRGLARAAVLLLLAAGVAADQLPGSPVRGWLGETLSRVRSALVGEPGDDAPATSDAATGPAASGVRVAAVGDRVRVVLSGLDPGSRIDVRLVDGSEAEVRGAGSGRYRTAPGVIEAVGPGSPVLVEIPRDVRSATVEVDGRIYLRKEGARLEVAGPASDTTDAEIRFRTPGGDGATELD